MESSDILFERCGAAGIVTLNRPKALNAVTHDMVRTLARQLRAWAGDAAATRVPSAIWTSCSLSADRLETAEAAAAGIATHHVRPNRCADLTDALCSNVSADATLAAFAEPAGGGAITQKHPAIDRLFAGKRV